MIPKRRVTSKHQQLFLGNCYTWNNFGHMDRNCKLKTLVEKGLHHILLSIRKILPKTIQKEETTILLLLYRVIVHDSTVRVHPYNIIIIDNIYLFIIELIIYYI